MHQRIQQLERLVMSIAARPSTAPRLPSASISSPAVAPPLAHSATNSSVDHGIMQAGNSPSHYVGSDHWAAIMDSIADLKDHFEQQEHTRLPDSPGQGHSSVDTADSGSGSGSGAGSGLVQQSTHSLLLYGQGAPLSHTELITALPSRATIDRYISRYFNRQEMISCESTSLSRAHVSSTDASHDHQL